MTVLDLGALISRAAPYVTSAITTSGTTVTVTRDPAGQPGTGTALATAVPALAISDAGGSSVDAVPGVPRRDGQWRILLHPDLVDVRDGDTVTLTASRDARLVGRRFKVVDVPDATPGVARTLIVQALPARGQP